MLWLVASAMASNLTYPEERIEHTVSLAGGHSGEVANVSLGWSMPIGFGESKRFRLGPGLRVMGFFAGEQVGFGRPFVTNLGSGSASQFSTFNTAVLNVGLYAQVQVTNHLEVGWNIDVHGLALADLRRGIANGPVSSSAVLGNGVSNSDLWIGVQPLPGVVTLFAAANVSTITTSTNGFRSYRRVDVGGRGGVRFIL